MISFCLEAKISMLKHIVVVTLVISNLILSILAEAIMDSKASKKVIPKGR